MDQERFDACMLRICNGDRNALKEIYEAYMKYVFSVIYRIVGNHTDAEDITADFFIRLWTTSDKYVPGSGHKAYLATIARNMAIDYLRKNKKEVLIGEFTDSNGGDTTDNLSMVISDAGDEASGDSPVESEVIGNMSLAEALAGLKPREQEIINLKIVGEMSFKEIAEITGSPMGTVAWLYRQAISKLRRCGYESES